MSKKISTGALLVALAMIFSYIETLIPIHFGVPGMKLGIANLVIVIGLYLLKPQEVLLISIVRILLAGFMFGSGMSVIYSLAGGILSFFSMLLLKHTGKFSIVGVSLFGGTTHNIGQLLVAAAVIENMKLFYYLPVLVIAGTVTGILIGLIAGRILPAVRDISRHSQNL